MTIRHILVDADYNDLGFSISKDFFGGEKIAVDAQIKVLYQENEEEIRAGKAGDNGNDPYLQEQERAEGISGKQGEGCRGYYDDVV